MQWDLAGQERFRIITSSCYRGASGALFVYDVSRRSSFEGVQKFIKEMMDRGHEEIPALLVANKMDLDGTREVSTEDGEV
jgi:small GTP-binding protein